MLSVLSNVFYFVLHVLNSGSFPKPLSAAEEKECLIKMKDGDENARARLIEHNLRLVAHIVKKYYAANVSQDDLISIGTIGLIKGISSFDPEKNIRLATYAARCIDNEILMHFRSLKKTAQDISINQPIDTDKDGNDLTLMDIIAVDDTVLDDVYLKIRSKQLYKMLDTLEKRERTIIVLRYGIGVSRTFTQKEVAKRLGISRSYVSRIEKKALGRLRKKFELADRSSCQPDSRINAGPD
ncbi:MAG: RNA polymerase sporulation sigma factor SigK [Clostridia bacterium]|nr:RNA polymerase sporulation sigma factor SigK [Clostridia bacterium]